MSGLDAISCRAWARTASQVDPDAVQYHAEGRLAEYVAKVDLEALLQRLACPVLLLQADEASGGVVSDEDVERAMELLADGMHARLEGAGHDLGLGTWDVVPLLRAVTGFLESP
jgi:pimeloyl-ACP methyl ester carboxylesterase